MAKQPKRFTDLVDELLKENSELSLDNTGNETDLGAEADAALEDGMSEDENVTISIPKNLVSALKEIVALLPSDEGEEEGEGEVESLDDVEDGIDDLDDMGGDDVGLDLDDDDDNGYLKKEETDEDEDVVEEECGAKKAPVGKPNTKTTIGKQEELKQKHQTVKKPAQIKSPKEVKNKS